MRKLRTMFSESGKAVESYGDAEVFQWYELKTADLVQVPNLPISHLN